jgi:hypothetical protein
MKQMKKYADAPDWYSYLTLILHPQLTAMHMVYTPLYSHAHPQLRHNPSLEYPLQLVGNDNQYNNPLCLGCAYWNYLRNDEYPDWVERYYGIYYWVYASWETFGYDDV